MTSQRTRRGALAISIATAAVLAACGGGGSDTATPDLVNGPGNPSGCPKAQASDVWINNRLGCLVVGQKWVSVSAGATGTAADRAYIMGQRVLNSSFNNVLGADVLRHFKYFVCVRGAPANIASLSVATDMATTLGIGSAIAAQYIPAGYSSSTLEASGGGTEPAVVAMACDPAVHPVIVDYATGKVQSINPAALTALQVYDK